VEPVLSRSHTSHHQLTIHLSVMTSRIHSQREMYPGSSL